MIKYIITAIISFLLGLFLKDFLPTYMKKKADNLATKEDIAEITHKTEDVKQIFQKEFATFSTLLKFKNEYANEQYVNLYSKLYVLVIQSEYCRQYLLNIEKMDIPFEEDAFVEISPIIKSTERISANSVIKEQEEIETDISKDNKKKLYELIIENSQYASQTLMKIAVAYRFIHSRYGPVASEKVNDEEVRLLKDLIMQIVKEYNVVRKALQLDYNEHEISSGYFDNADLFR